MNPAPSPRLTPSAGVVQLPLAGSPVDALVPLALLESVRTLDLPAVDVEPELVHELRNKRFGLSDTVYRQIKRYGESVRRQQRVPFDEVLALAHLVGRRPDAALVFREAGRRVAHAALASGSATTRRAGRLLPGPIGRPIALRSLRAICQRYLDGQLERQGSTLLLEVPFAVTADAAPDGGGCGLQEAALRELLLGLTGVDHAIQAVACRSRGDRTCQWRTDWRR